MKPSSSGPVGKSVLIVDSRNGRSEALRRLLLKAGYDPLVVSGGDAALAACADQPPDLALVAAKPADGSGTVLCRQLVGRFTSLPVVLILDDFEPQLRAACYEAGAADYIVEPLLEPELLLRLERLTGAGSAAGRATEPKPETEHLAAMLLRDDRLRLLFDALPMSVLAFDKEGRFAFVNRVCEAWYGKPREEIIGKRLDDFFDPSVQREFDDAHAEVIALRHPIERELERHYPDGTDRLLHTVVVPVLDHNREFEGQFVLLRDITVRRRAEQALLESEARLRLLADSLPLAVFSYDLQGRYVFANKLGQKWLNRPAEKILGLHPRELLGEAFDRELAEAMSAALAGRTESALAHLDHPDGHSRVIEVTYVPSFGEDGVQSGLFSVAQDMTLRLKAEAQLRKSEAMLSESQRIGGLGSWEWSEDGDQVVSGSKTFFEIHGLDPDQGSIDGTYLQLVHPDDRDACLRLYDVTLEDPRPYTHEHRIIRPDGGVRHLLKRAEPLFDDTGRLTGFRGTAQDITDFKLLETQLYQAQKMEAVGQLTGGLAHDFNNLLAVIIGNAELLADRVEGEDRIISALISAASRGADLTQRLLAFSRKQALQPTTVAVNELVRDMISLLRRSIGETIEVEVAITPALWPCEVDPGQLENAILNLAINARDAMKQGGLLTIQTENYHLESGEIAARFEIPPGDYVRLSVTDSGCGIPPELLDRVFEPFFTTKEVGEGSGLGLVMIFGFAKQSGGHATIESAVDRGTTVRLYLPRARRSAETQARGRVQHHPDSGRGETILVVEDDVDLRSLIVQILDSLGYRVLAADSGMGALDALDQSSDFDLLLTDVVLPGGIGGRELAQEAVRRHRDLEVLFMSGYSRDAISHEGRLEEGVQLLQKPFRRAEIAAAVRKALDKSVA